MSEISIQPSDRTTHPKPKNIVQSAAEKTFVPLIVTAMALHPVSPESQDNPNIPQANTDSDTTHLVIDRNAPTIADRTLSDYVAQGPEQSQARKEIEIQQKILKRDSNGMITPHFREALAVVEDKDIQAMIISEANTYGIPKDIALGVALLENGGGRDEINKITGARGIYQLMEETAKEMGLRVVRNSKDPTKFLVDERSDPQMNIKAGNRYLARQIQHTGDTGLGILAYYAGVKNVYDFINIYAKSFGYALPDPKVAVNNHSQMERYKYYVHKQHVSVHALLNNADVKAYIANPGNDFTPETFTYVYQVLAAAEEMSVPKPASTITFPDVTKANTSNPRKDGAVL